MSMGSLSPRLAKKLAGKCMYSGCDVLAKDGASYCESHHEQVKEKDREWRATRRAGHPAGRCLDCGERCGGWRRCKTCRKKQAKRRRVDSNRNRVDSNGADPAFARVARTKVERAYDKLASGSERFIERTVFRSRGGQSRESMDADEDQMLQWIAEGVEGHARRRQRLRDEEPALGRQQRKEASAIVGERIFSAAKCLLEIAARYNRESFALMAEWTRLMVEGEDDDEA